MKRALILLAACHSEPTCEVDTCSPAADCKAGECFCPSGFIPPDPMFTTGLMRDVPQLPGLRTGIGVISQDGFLHGLLVAFDPAAPPTDVDLANPGVTRVGFGYQVDPLMNIRGAYLATSGSMHVTEACLDGVTGTLTNVEAIEIDLFADLAPVPNGCSLSIQTLTFAIGSCP